MDEPAILKAPGIDQAVVIRDIGEIQNDKSGKYYLPGFSALHDVNGRKIAELNGSKDPFAFWTKHYIEATGRALGELAARTGMQLDSPHSQNFLIELDTNYKPTGRIVIRDMADFYVHSRYMEAMSPQHLEGYYEKNILNKISASFGPLHGNKFPSWVSVKRYAAWKDVFYQAFEKSFFNKSGLRRSDVLTNASSLNGHYFSKSYTVSTEGSERNIQFWQNLEKYKSPRGILNCSYVFSL